MKNLLIAVILIFGVLCLVLSGDQIDKDKVENPKQRGND